MLDAAGAPTDPKGLHSKLLIAAVIAALLLSELDGCVAHRVLLLRVFTRSVTLGGPCQTTRRFEQEEVTQTAALSIDSCLRVLCPEVMSELVEEMATVEHRQLQIAARTEVSGGAYRPCR